MMLDGTTNYINLSYVIKMNNPVRVGVAVLLLCGFNDRVLLFKRKAKKGVQLDFTPSWSMCGGKMETTDKSIFHAAQRELLEEAGMPLHPNENTIITFNHNSINDMAFVTFTFVQRIPEQDIDDYMRKIKLDEGEVSIFDLYYLNDLPSNLYKPTRCVLDQYLGKESITEQMETKYSI